MPRATHVQTSFTAGEISPRLLGRTDLNRYQSGVQSASNIVIYPHGMAARRPGTKFVAYSKGSAAARLIPFQYNDDQSYVIECTGTALRFYRDGGQISEAKSVSTASWSSGTATITIGTHTVVENDYVVVTGVSPTGYNVSGYVTGVTATTIDLAVASDPGAYSSGGSVAVPYEVTSPWAASDISKLKWVQSADILYICHPDYLPRQLARTGTDTFALSVLELENGPFDQVPGRARLTVGPVHHDATQVDGTVYKTGSNAADYRGDEVGDHYSIRIQDERYNFDHDGGDGTTGVHIGRLIKFKWDTEDFTVALIYQTISAKEAYAVILRKGGTIADSSTADISPQAVSADEWYIGDFYGAFSDSVHQTKLVVSATWAGNVLTVNTTQKHCLNTGESVTISGMEYDGATDPNVTASATRVSSTQFTIPLVGDPGTITGDTGSVAVPKFLENLTDEGDADEMNQPSIPAFYQQRLWLAKTNQKVNRIYGSSVGDFPNFRDSEFESSYATLDTDAVILTIDDDQVNEIRWLKSTARGLVIGTNGAEYSVSGSTSLEAITPSNIRALRQTEFGSADGAINALVNRSLLFVHRSGTRLIELGYSFDADQQVGNDVSIVSEHILKNGVKEIAYQEVPVQLIWMVLDNGNLVSFTYEPQQEVYGWARSDFGGDGQAEAVAVIPEDDEDAPWFVVKRGSNRTIEVMQAPVDIDTIQSDCWYVDAGLKMDVTNTASTDLMKYVGVYTAGGMGTLNATAHTPFAGDSTDVGKRFRLYATDNSYYDFDVTAAISTSQCEVTLITAGLPTELQNLDTASWAELTTTWDADARQLDHLNGQTLKVLADGGVHDDLTVADGSITFNDYVAKAIVGHGYNSELKGLPIRVTQYFTETRGKVSSLYDSEIRVWRSLGGDVSYGEGDAEAVQYRTPGEAFGNAPALKSETIQIGPENDYDLDQYIKIATSDPVPFNVLSIVYELDINDQV